MTTKTVFRVVINDISLDIENERRREAMITTTIRYESYQDAYAAIEKLPAGSYRIEKIIVNELS